MLRAVGKGSGNRSESCRSGTTLVMTSWGCLPSPLTARVPLTGERTTSLSFRREETMSKSYAKWALPAHVGGWWFDLDDRHHPTEAIIWREGTVNARLPFRGL